MKALPGTREWKLEDVSCLPTITSPTSTTSLTSTTSNVFSEGSILKRRHQGLKTIRRSKLPKTESQRFERDCRRLDKDKVISKLSLYRGESCDGSELYLGHTLLYSAIQPVCWLVSELISSAGAGLLWEENTVGWLISPGWNQQTNMLIGSCSFDQNRIAEGLLLGVYYMLVTPLSCFRPNYMAYGLQNNVWKFFVAFNDIFVNTNPI